MKTNKKCQSCGKQHNEVPGNARPQMDYHNQYVIGLFWECSCGSSLLHIMPAINVPMAVKKLNVARR